MKKYIVISAVLQGDILHLKLQPKHNRDRLQFQAGQYAAISYRNRRGQRTPMRCFSIVSSPTNSDEIEFGIRVLGPFTQSLTRLRPGAAIQLEGPFGDFVIDDRYDRNIVMLAGGIGITPFVSMIRERTENSPQLPLTLLHSTRQAGDLPFYDELQSLMAANPKFKAYNFVSDSATIPAGKRLLPGRIEAKQIAQLTSGFYAGSTYFVCGPRGFMNGMIHMLKEEGVTEDRIISEAFTQTSKVVTDSGRNLSKLIYAASAAILFVGIAGIALMDLARWVPNHSVSASQVQTTSQTDPTATSTNSVSTDTSSTSGTSSSASSAGYGNSPTTTAPSYQYYSPPMSRMS